MTRGDTFIFDVDVINPDKSTFDLTGYAIKFTAKRSPYDSAALFERTAGNGGIFTPTAGVVRVKIVPANTDDVYDDPLLYWDIEITKDGDVYTVASDRLRVKNDITK